MTKKYNRTYVAFQITKPNDEPEQTKSKLSERRIDHVQTHTYVHGTHTYTHRHKAYRRSAGSHTTIISFAMRMYFHVLSTSMWAIWYLAHRTTVFSSRFPFSTQSIQNVCVFFFYILNFSLFMCRETNVVEYCRPEIHSCTYVRTVPSTDIQSLRKMYI